MDRTDFWKGLCYQLLPGRFGGSYWSLCKLEALPFYPEMRNGGLEPGFHFNTTQGFHCVRLRRRNGLL